MNKLDEVLTRGVEKILPDKKGLADLMLKKKIKLYQGFDPSMPSLHLGNLVGLVKLAQFQKLGHEVIFLVGDFTGMIGDPTDKLATRKQLTRKQVMENAKSWKQQASKLLDFEGKNPAKILFNSEWSDKTNFKDLIEITSKFTVQQMLERDMFQERLKKNEPIYLHELLYPVAQAQDCVEMDVDLEIGGNDQLFNIMAGRTLMKSVKGKEKYVLTTKLLIDKEGNKVGKTTGNALFLDSTPEILYAGIMSFPDEVIYLGFELLTSVSLENIEKEIKKDPMTSKKKLAFEIVKMFWGEKNAKDSQGTFEKTFQKGQLPKNMKEIKLKENSLPLLDLVFASKLVSSRSEAKRLINQKAVDVNEKTINDTTHEVKLPAVLKIGKTKFVKIVKS
ncbi:tyrosine--tRNA ligase [Patescibacteria group bacterium]